MNTVLQLTQLQYLALDFVNVMRLLSVDQFYEGLLHIPLITLKVMGLVEDEFLDEVDIASPMINYLTKQSSLKTLWLHGRICWKGIGVRLAQLNHINELTLAYCDFDDDTSLMSEFCKELNHNIGYKSLCFENIFANRFNFEEISNNTTLEKLTINLFESISCDNPYSIIDNHNLCNFLKANRTLKELTLSEQAYNYTLLPELANTLKNHNTTLQVLDLTCNRFSKSAQILIDGLNTQIQCKILYDGSYSPEDNEKPPINNSKENQT